jgi:Caspase domain
MESLDVAQTRSASEPNVRGHTQVDLTTAIEGPAARFGRNLAVIIGIDRYGDGISPLRSAVADATAIAEALRHDHGFETWRVFDEDASRSHLLALLSGELPAALGPNDRLLLYFAGHGIALHGDTGPAGYLLPVDARRTDRNSFLPMHAVNRALARLPVRHVLVILDCCFAGTFRWSSLRDVEPATARIYRERYDRYVESPAWQVLTSASADQLALDMLADDRGEGAGTHSPFALALLEGLGGAADYTDDYVITASELALFVRERVAPAAESAGHRQIPQLFPLDRHDSGEFVFQVPGRALALAPAPPLDQHANPYRGLESFREQDSALFFGRTEVARRLIDTVISQQLTVVVGPSGAGKSSLVHAALVPELRERGWTVLPTQRPGRDPLTALEVWARALRSDPSPNGPVAAWLTSVARRNDDRPGQPWLVVIDQFEELLTHRTAERDRAVFLGALASALNLSSFLRVVVTVRSDSEPQFHDTALGPWWTAARFIMPGMTRDELREIIEGPATAAVLNFEPSGLVERLLDDVALVPAPLPLLSFALSELYRRCGVRWKSGIHDRSLRALDYDEMGSVARALTHRATALHDQLIIEDAAYAGTIRNVFTRMVAVVGGEAARCRVPTDELTYDDPDEDRRVAEVLQRFHEARLISLGIEDGSGEPNAYAEPTHDALVRGWTRVGRWLEELDTPFGTRALLGAVSVAARAWQAGGEASELLWNDARVELAHALARGRPFVFNTSEARFVARSAHLRRNQRFRLVGGLVAVICVLSVAAGVALWQRKVALDYAERATANEQRAVDNDKRATESEKLRRDSVKRATAGEKEVECLRYQSDRKWRDLDFCADQLNAVNPTAAREFKKRGIGEMCASYQSERRWGDLDSCAERLEVLDSTAAREFKKRAVGEICTSYQSDRKWEDLDSCAERLEMLDPIAAREFKKRAIGEVCISYQSEQKWEDLDSCAERLKMVDPIAAKDFKKRALGEICISYQSERKWEDLDSCAERLKMADPTAAKEFKKRVVFESEGPARIAAFEAALRAGNLKRAKVEFDEIPTSVAVYPKVREQLLQAEDQAIADVVYQLQWATDCKSYDEIVQKEKESKSARVITEVTSRSECCSSGNCRSNNRWDL